MFSILGVITLVCTLYFIFSYINKKLFGKSIREQLAITGFKVISAISILFIINLLLNSIGIMFLINSFSVLVIAILGFPGLITVILLQLTFMN